VNQAAASLGLDGIVPGSPLSVTTATKCVGDATTLNVNSNLAAATPWDVAIAAGLPLVPGLGLPSCQVINVDIAAGAPTWLSTGLPGFSPPLALAWGGGPLSLPFLAPGPVTAHAQGLFVNAAEVEGFTLTAPVQLVTSLAGSLSVVLADDNFVAVDPALQPICSPTNVSFYGTNYQTFFVNSNGSLGFNAGDGDFSVTEPEWLAGSARAAPFWTDLSPNIAGTVILSAVPGGVNLAFSCPHFNAPASVNQATVQIDGSGVTISGYAPDAGNLNPSIIGITPGGGAGGASQSWAAIVGSGLQAGPALNAVYEFNGAGNVAGGWTSINFPVSDGSFYIVN
jgi:hypothetical protein